jgi:antitoxin (DNA-binding transcriptional repressor) of toxin-antitoxin stability system
MKSLSLSEIGAQLSKLDHLVKLEGEIIITLDNKPIARLLPPRQNSKTKPSHADLRAMMPKLSTPSEQLIREEREAR